MGRKKIPPTRYPQVGDFLMVGRDDPDGGIARQVKVVAYSRVAKPGSAKPYAFLPCDSQWVDKAILAKRYEGGHSLFDQINIFHVKIKTNEARNCDMYELEDCYKDAITEGGKYPEAYRCINEYSFMHYYGTLPYIVQKN